MSERATQEQQAAIRSDAHTICVDAGAGSGKTRVLIARLVDLIERKGVQLDEIVAITFMEKAAAEMKARLRDAFRKKASAQPEEAARWRELERRTDGARISTIHGFCLGFLRENALHIGLDPDFTMLGDADAELLVRESITQGLHALFEQRDQAVLRLAAELNGAQLYQVLRQMLRQARVLERVASPAVYSDPAKLHAHWQRALKRERRRQLETLHHNPDVRYWLREMEALDGACENPEHNREQFRRLIMSSLRVILDGATPDAAAQALQRIADVDLKKGRKARGDWALDDAAYDAFKKLTDEIRKYAKAVLDDSMDPVIEETAASRTADLWHVYRAIREHHDAAKAARNALDFDDLIARTQAWLEDADDLRRRTAAGIRHLLIDEFQDTDASQLAIARALNSAPNGPDLFIVGDAKQSIYLFRGAEVEVFHHQRQESQEKLALAKNFRSLPDVLSFVNHFFHETGLLAAVGDYAGIEAARQSADKPRVEFLLPVPAQGDLAGDLRRKEAELIARRIAQMCGEEAPLSVNDPETGQARPACFADVAVLTRAMSQLHIYEEALRTLRIPYLVTGGGGFYERQEVLDVLNLLKTVLDPWDEAALFAYLRSPIAALSDDDLVRAGMKNGIAAAFAHDAIPPGLDAPDRWQRARELIEGLRAVREQPLPVFLRHVLETTQYEAILLAQHLGLQRASNLRKLMQLADSFTRTQPPTLRAFVAYLDDVRSEAVREGDAPMQSDGAGAVHIMTIHKAKGLEFPVVFLPDIARSPGGGRDLPLTLHRDVGFALKVTDSDGQRTAPAIAKAIDARVKAEELAEHARVLYVAMTRARDHLVLAGADTGRMRRSWLEAFDRQYDVCTREGGGGFRGAGWAATVLHTLPESAPLGADKAQTVLPAAHVLRQRIAPVQGDGASRAVSVSRLLDMAGGTIGGDDAIAPHTRPGRLDPRVRGNLAHALFEWWHCADNTPPDIGGLLRQHPVPLTMRAAVHEDLEAIAARFAASDLAKQLCADPNPLREAGFLYALDAALIAGTIDLLLSDGTIVDYKTGGIHERTAARYALQLRLYALTVRDLIGLTPRVGILWYVDQGEAHEVDLAPAHLEETRATMAHILEPEREK